MSNPEIRTDIGQRLQDGRQLHRKKFQALEVVKLGNLRAGNSGIMSSDGNIAGGCHRVAHLRQLGLELDPPDDSKLIMFQMGIANEDEIFDDLVHTAVPGEVVRREEEIPIQWFTANNTKVTGRPDLVICRQEYTIDEKHGAVPSKVIPVLGLELKSVASVWTTREILFESKPKMAHLVQVGHYMWQLNVPFKLIYKQYGLQSFPDFARKFFPAIKSKLSEFMGYNDSGDPKNVKPFEIVYDVVYGPNGFLQFRREGTKKWSISVITADDIRRYYEFISTMSERKLLGPKPLTTDYNGEEKSFSNCKYCPLQTVCKKVDLGKRPGTRVAIGYDQWLREVKQVLANPVATALE